MSADRVKQWLDDGCPSWGLPEGDIRKLIAGPIDMSEKVGDLVRDAFYEACETMQTWNGTLGPMSQDELFAAWMESEARKQLVAAFPTLTNGVRSA